MRITLAFLSLPLFIVSACSPSSSSTTEADGGAPDGDTDVHVVDAHAPVDASPAPDGVGVCCPVDVSPCSPVHVGGWAARSEECPGDPEAEDGCPFLASVDSHGCATLTEPSAFSCTCQCGAVSCGHNGDDDAGDAGDASDAPKADAGDGG